MLYSRIPNNSKKHRASSESALRCYRNVWQGIHNLWSTCLILLRFFRETGESHPFQDEYLLHYIFSDFIRFNASWFMFNWELARDSYTSEVLWYLLWLWWSNTMGIEPAEFAVYEVIYLLLQCVHWIEFSSYFTRYTTIIMIELYLMSKVGKQASFEIYRLHFEINWVLWLRFLLFR